MIGIFKEELKKRIFRKPTNNVGNRTKKIIKTSVNLGELPRISGTEEDFNKRIITPDKEKIER